MTKKQAEKIAAKFFRGVNLDSPSGDPYPNELDDLTRLIQNAYRRGLRAGKGMRVRSECSSDIF